MTKSPRPRNLFASVATYKTPAVDAAVELLRLAFAELILPYAVGEAIEHVVSFGQLGATRMTTRPYGKAKWSEIVATPNLAWILLSAWRERDLEAGHNPALATVLIHFAEPEVTAGATLPPQRASAFEFAARQTIYGEHVPLAVQQQLVTWAGKTFAQSDGVTGYLTLDYVRANAYGSMSPYEISVGLSYPWAALEFRQKVRGYYWGNLLGPAQVALLGGPEPLQKLPAARCEPLSPDGVYLQLTDDINHIDRDRLQELKQLLLPLLPQGYPKSPEEYARLPAFIL